MRYYTEAIRGAAYHLCETGRELTQPWHQVDVPTPVPSVERLIATAQYIQNATQSQGTSSQKLATTLQLATQVTEQLTTGATSATETATQLEQVVQQLRSVVGK